MKSVVKWCILFVLCNYVVLVVFCICVFVYVFCLSFVFVFCVGECVGSGLNECDWVSKCCFDNYMIEGIEFDFFDYM